MIRFVFLLFVLGGRLFAGDCVPLTLTTLSGLAKTPIAYNDWATDLDMKKGTPSMADAISCWNHRFLFSPLVPVYSVISDVKSLDRPIDRKGIIPYLWFGKVPNDLAADPADKEFHCALVFCHEDYVDIIHTFDNNEHYLVESIDFKTFLNRTFAVYEVVPSIKLILWGRLPTFILQTTTK